jgi:hypothetical protein
LAAEQQVKDLVARKALGCSSGQGDEVVVRPDKCEHEALEFDRQCSQQEVHRHRTAADGRDFDARPETRAAGAFF